MKTIVSSRTYQLSHSPNATNREDVTNYSRSLARGLDAEVLLDAVADVTGIPETFSTAITDGATVGQAPAGTRAIQLRDPDTFFSRFLELYGRVQSRRGSGAQQQAEPRARRCTCLPEPPMWTASAGPNSRLARLLESGRDRRGHFHRILSGRAQPSAGADELQEFKTILAQRGDREAGLREFVWALISSREFAENH